MQVWAVYVSWEPDDDVKGHLRLFLQESDAQDYSRQLFLEGYDGPVVELMEVS
jgi:hypothetical protein